MPPIDVTNVELWISANNGAGTYTMINDLRSYDATHGSEGDARTRVFGKTDPYVRVGDDTDEYSFEGLYNPTDTNGQNILRNSKDTGSLVYIAVLHVPTVGAEEGYTQQVQVTEYAESADSDGEYVECSFSMTATGPRVALVGGLP
jgi:hypothetical protein